MNETHEDWFADGSPSMHQTMRSLLDKADTMTKTAAANKFVGGDPCNAFHELRRYLLQRGVDTRIYTFGMIPLPLDLKTQPAIDEFMGSVDNSFFFDFRKAVSSNDFQIKTNVMVLLCRVFFENSQNSSTFHVQLVLNHDGDAQMDLNQFYSSLIPPLQEGGWVNPAATKEGRITFYEKSFTNYLAFEREFDQLLVLFQTHQVYNTII